MSDDVQEQTRVLVLIPTYGDAEAIPRLVSEIRDLGPRYSILIVDDGSPVPLPPLEGVLQTRLAANFGLGVVVHVALDHAVAHGYRHVVRVDSDGQHRISDIPRLVECLDAGADVAVGSRALILRSYRTREILAYLAKVYFAILTRIVAGPKLPRDVTSGLQAFGQRTISLLRNVELERYPEPQVLVLAGRRALRIDVVPIEELKRQSGESTIDIGRGIQTFYRFNILILRELFQGAGRT